MPITQAQILQAQSFQFAAARDPSPQVRLIAGPGTGKSHAVVERVRWLLDSGIDPADIYVVSFTRASSLDLKRRVVRYCETAGLPQSSHVPVSTLHSLALRALRRANLLHYPVEPMVLDQFEIRNILDAEFTAQTGYPLRRCREIREDYEAFSGTGSYEPANYIPPDPPITAAERQAYVSFHGPRTQLYSCVLPGDIVRQCVDYTAAGMMNPPQLLAIRSLIADEYQDFNPADLEFTDSLIHGGVPTLITGDDDQSIYSFRFASPEGIQSLDQRFPGVAQHTLPHCFRCTPLVLDAAQSLIRRFPQPNRLPKVLGSLYVASEPPEQGVVHRWIFSHAILEARQIAHACAALIEGGIPARELMILLAYTQLQLETLAPEMDAAAVPYTAPKAPRYIDSFQGRFVFALLRLVCDPNDFVAYRLLVGLRPRVGPTTCNRIAETSIQHNISFRDLFFRHVPPGVFPAREETAILRTRSLLQRVLPWSPDDALSVREPELSEILDAVFGEGAHQAFLAQLLDVPAEMTLSELRDLLWAETNERRAAVLETAYLRLGIDPPQAGFEPNAVRVLTMHGAKGLDASVVFIPGLEEPILPGSSRTPYPGLVLEGARMLYVSITRAKAAAIMSYSQARVMYGHLRRPAPSRYAAALGGRFDTRVGPPGLSPAEQHAILQAYAHCRP